MADESWGDLHESLVSTLTSDDFMGKHPELPTGPEGDRSLSAPVRHFQGDGSIKTFAGDVGNAYQKAMTKAGVPEETVKNLRAGVEDLAAKKARVHALKMMQKAGAGLVEGTTTMPGARYLPGPGHLVGAEEDELQRKSMDSLEAGTATLDDYKNAGRALVRQRQDQERGEDGFTGWGQRRLRNLAGLGQFFGDVAMTGGAGTAAGGLVGGTGLVAGGARIAASGLATSALTPQRFIADYAASGRLQMGIDDQGNIGLSEPESKGARVYHSLVSGLIDNTIMPGVAGAFTRAEAGTYAARVLKKTLMAMAGAESAADIKKLMQAAPEGGPIWNVAAAVQSGDPKQIQKSLTEAAGMMLEMGLFEGVVQSQRKGHSVDKAAADLTAKVADLSALAGGAANPIRDKMAESGPQAVPGPSVNATPEQPVEAPKPSQEATSQSEAPTAAPAPEQAPTKAVEQPQAVPEAPKEQIEELRARLKAVGLNSGKMKPEEVLAKAKQFKLDQFEEKPPEPGGAQRKQKVDRGENELGRMVEEMSGGPYRPEEISEIMQAWRTVRAASAAAGGSFRKLTDLDYVRSHAPQYAEELKHAFDTITGYHKTLDARHGGWEPPKGWSPHDKPTERPALPPPAEPMTAGPPGEAPVATEPLRPVETPSSPPPQMSGAGHLPEVRSLEELQDRITDHPELTRQEKRVLMALTAEGASFAEVGRREPVPVSKQRVQQIEQEALKKMNAPFASTKKWTEAITQGKEGRGGPTGRGGEIKSEAEGFHEENVAAEPHNPYVQELIRNGDAQSEQEALTMLADEIQRPTDVADWNLSHAQKRELNRAERKAADAISKDAKRIGVQPEALRHSIASFVRARLEARRAAAAPQAGQEPAAAHGQPEAAVSGGEAAGNKLSSEFGKPLTPEEKARGMIGGGQENAPPGAAQGPLKETALANAKIDAERKLQQLSPILSEARQSNPETWDRAMEQLDKNPQAGEELVKRIMGGKRATSAEENAILLRRRIQLRNEYQRTVGDYIEARRGQADALTLDALEAKEEQLSKDIDLADKAARLSGAEWGRAGQFRRQLAREDFSLAGMLKEAVASIGKPLSREETQKLQEQVLARQQQIEELQKKLDAAEESLKAKQITPAEFTKINAELQRPKNDWQAWLDANRKASRPAAEKAMNWWIKYRVAEVISSPVTLAKIAAASLERIAISPLEEAAGSVLAQLPGIGKIAAMAPREGRGLSPIAEKKAFISAFTEGMKDAWKTLKTGKSDLDVQFGGKAEARSYLDWIGDSHAALKSPAVRAEFTRSFLKRLDAAAARGEDISSPAKVLQIGAEAFMDGQAAKFQNDNWLADSIKKFTDYKRGAGLGEKAFKTGVKTIMPVVRIPTNIVAETFQYAFGTVTGGIRAGAAIAKGIENLKPAEADVIMKSLKKGSLGLAALAVGYFNPTMFGGFYTGQKRDEKDVKVGAARIGGVDAPTWTQHNPLLMVFQYGASIRRAADGIGVKNKTSFGEAVIHGTRGLVEETPLVRTTIETAKAFDPRTEGRYFGNLAKSLAIPQFLQWMANANDVNASGETVKRQTKTIGQNIQSGIPGERNLLPAR